MSVRGHTLTSSGVPKTHPPSHPKTPYLCDTHAPLTQRLHYLHDTHHTGHKPRIRTAEVLERSRQESVRARARRTIKRTQLESVVADRTSMCSIQVLACGPCFGFLFYLSPTGEEEVYIEVL